jgi:hypothetical protein
LICSERKILINWINKFEDTEADWKGCNIKLFSISFFISSF